MAECLMGQCNKPARGRGLCGTHYHYARRHNELPALKPGPDPVETFWSRVDQTGGPEACWPWTRAINGNGYGSLSWQNKSATAYRVAYELTHGPVPEGMHLDHLCHTNDETCRGGKTCPHRRCANPAHLEPVTNLVNVMRGRSPHASAARQTHCVQGHEFTPENTVTYPSRKQRVCLTCKRAAGLETMRKRKDQLRDYMREWRAKRKAAA